MSEFYINEELSLEALIYDTFYRKYGIFKSGDLLAPRLSPITHLELPKNSVAHHYSTDDISIGPEPEGLLFKNYPGRMLVEHVSELYEPIGQPRPNRTLQSSRLTRDYHRRFRKMRPLHGFDKVIRNELTLPIINYAQLNQLFWYMRSVFSNFYKWHNIYKTLFYNLNEYCRRSPERQHFLLASLPKQLPSLEYLKIGAKNSAENMSRRLLEVFAQPESFFILEMWKFFGQQRENALMSMIDKAHFNNINIVWHDSGQWFGMNLGKVLELDPGTDESSDAGSNRLQRVFLRMLIRLAEGRSDAVVEPQDAAVVEPEDTTDSPTDASGDEQDDVPEELEVGKEVDDDLDDLLTEFDPDMPDPIGDEPTPKKTTNLPKPTQSTKQDDDLDEESIEADLEILERLTTQSETRAEEAGSEAPPRTPREALTRKLDRLAEEGRVSAGEYRRFLKLIEKSDSIPNPFGAGTLKEFGKVDPEAVQIKPETVKIPKLKGVIDDSMLESTLLAMDRQYIEEVLQRDIVNAAMSVEAAGVIVTDYKVEDVVDVANHYRVMSMRINPIDGEPSTLRFRIPVVNENGVFESNGVKYRMRKQRVDLPIRKVSPSSVALTSYYAKVFVDRSDKSVVNYGKWITNQIVLLDSGEQKDRKVKNVRYVNVLVTNVKLPRIYSILASKFREFTVDKDLRLYFDYNRRLKLNWAPDAAKHEEDGFVFCGMQGKNYITVDATNTFYLTEGRSRRVLGSIEDLLGLDASKAPVEIAEFRLFSRNVPVGIALGYHYGLERLMQILGVTPRRVPTGQRLGMTPDEYAIRFADETLVFSKTDQRAQLVLAGLNRYHKSIARYQVSSFDHKDVYVNIMEDNGIRVGFIRELELAMDMYVDPITRELLEEMGEPTTLDGLLLRSCELLLTDWSPDETDMTQMRIRGYERMAGAVYAEMTKAIRRYRSRGVGREAKVELNPEAVWMSIHQDAVGVIEESNPIKNLKEKELVTYMGTGGRSARSMVKATRAFHETDLGVISESSVDSGSVGINIYMTANPQFKSLRGVVKPVKVEEAGAASLLSTSMLLAPGTDCDD